MYIKKEIVMVIIVVLGLIFGICIEKYLYTKSDNVLVQTKLQELGFANIVIGGKSFEFGGFGRCTREDVVSFDFAATLNGKQIENMYICVGVTTGSPFDPQISLRPKN